MVQQASQQSLQVQHDLRVVPQVSYHNTPTFAKSDMDLVLYTLLF